MINVSLDNAALAVVISTLTGEINRLTVEAEALRCERDAARDAAGSRASTPIWTQTPPRPDTDAFAAALAASGAMPEHAARLCAVAFPDGPITAIKALREYRKRTGAGNFDLRSCKDDIEAERRR